MNLRLCICFLIILFWNPSSYSQVENGDFGEWEIYKNKDKPVHWFCPNIAKYIGPCDKRVIQKDISLRLENNMPCRSSLNTLTAFGDGFIEQSFDLSEGVYQLSLDLEIDSILHPACLYVSILAHNFASNRDTLYKWSYCDTITETIQKQFIIDSEADSILLHMSSIGHVVPDGIHECDRGRIVAIIDNVVIERSSSVEEQLKDNTLIYPNPFIDQLSILSSEPFYKYTIRNMLGQVVYEGSTYHTGEFALDLSSLNTGKYLLSLINSKSIQTFKIYKI